MFTAFGQFEYYS